MADDFIPTHESIVPAPPKANIKYYDPAKGHIAVAAADSVERDIDGRDGTLLQGSEKTPVAVYNGDAIIEYEEPRHVYAAMRPGDVSAWFKPIIDDSVPKLPKKSSAKSVSDE